MPAKTHGSSCTPEYAIWCAMKARCRNPKSPAYPRYGGRGIQVCDRWMESFEAFVKDMGWRPNPQYLLDRIDNDGNYEPGNVRWATLKQSNRNRRNAHLLTHNGQTRTVAGWAEVLGVSRQLIISRLNKGWSVERTLTEKQNFTNNWKRRWATHEGQSLPVSEWAKRLGIAPSTLRRRLDRGWSVEKALTAPVDNHQSN